MQKQKTLQSVKGGVCRGLGCQAELLKTDWWEQGRAEGVPQASQESFPKDVKTSPAFIQRSSYIYLKHLKGESRSICPFEIKHEALLCS